MSPEVVIIAFQFVVLIFGLTVHEAAHAWTASRLGDQTARMLGRVTLNPAKQLDPLGSVLIPLISMYYGFWLIGYAKPTPVQPRNFASFRRDSILVTLAGPVSNLLLAMCFLLALLIVKHAAGAAGIDAIENAQIAMARIPFEPGGLLRPVTLLLYCGVLVNLVLFLFNLVPIPPLDGSRILDLYLPPGLSMAYARMARFSYLILMGLAYLGVFGYLYHPAYRLVDSLLVSL